MPVSLIDVALKDGKPKYNKIAIGKLIQIKTIIFLKVQSF
jgi:hypothetical protein